jgi:hypothetical protein
MVNDIKNLLACLFIIAASASMLLLAGKPLKAAIPETKSVTDISDSFETDDDKNGVPDGWVFVGQKSRVSLTKIEAKSGEHSILVDRGPGRKGTGAMYRSSPVAVQGGQVYEISAWVKVERADEGSYARALVHFLDENKEIVSKLACYARISGGNWYRIYAVDKAPADASYATIFAPYVRGGMRVFMDDVAFTKIETKEKAYSIQDVSSSFEQNTSFYKDANFQFFGAGGNGYLFGSTKAVNSMELNKRRSRTVGVRLSPYGKIKEFIAEDIKYHPYVSTWKKFGPNLYPHNRTGRRLGVYVTAYKLTGDQAYLKRVKELADFLVYSQYKNGTNSFLKDYYPEEYDKLKKRTYFELYDGGWPTHDFEWHNEHYRFPKYEPSHHMDARAAFNLLRAFEVTGDTKYLNSASRFVEGSNRLFGVHEGVWQGDKYYWTEYDPIAPIGSANDAVDNVVSWYAMAVAALGYHTGDSKTIELARGLLWYMCKEIMRDGRWYYFGEEAFIPPAKWSPSLKRKISHEPSCLIAVNRALLYLESLGVVNDRMKMIFRDANLMYSQLWGDNIKAIKFNDFNTTNTKNEVLFSTFVYVKSDDINKLLFADSIPSGFEQPAKITISVAIGNRHEKLVKRYEELKTGILVDSNPAVGDVYEISYRIKKPIEPISVPPADTFRKYAELKTVPTPLVTIIKKDGTIKEFKYPHVQTQQFWHSGVNSKDIKTLPMCLFGPLNCRKRPFIKNK